MRGRAVLVALALLPLASCSGGDDDDATTLRLDGRAELTGSADRTLAAGEHELQDGDRVRLLEGTAVLELPGDRRLELRSGSWVTAGEQVAVDDGDALLLAGDDELVVTAGRSTVRLVDGAAKLRRSTGTTIGVYRGTAALSALGRSFAGGVRAYRQATVSDSGSLPRRAVPLVYAGTTRDPWDARFLGEAIDLDREVAQRSRALGRDLGDDDGPSARQDPDFYEEVLPDLAAAPGFDEDLLDVDRSPAETVVGASVALAGDGSFVERWRSTFAFRDEGAEWGLVALDQQARRPTLLDLLSGAVGRAFSEAAGGQTPAPSGTSTTTTTTSPGPGAPTTTTTTTAPPSTTLPTLPDELDPVAEPVTDLIEDLLGVGLQVRLRFAGRS